MGIGLPLNSPRVEEWLFFYLFILNMNTSKGRYRPLKPARFIQMKVSWINVALAMNTFITSYFFPRERIISRLFSNTSIPLTKCHKKNF